MALKLDFIPLILVIFLIFVVTVHAEEIVRLVGPDGAVAKPPVIVSAQRDYNDGEGPGGCNPPLTLYNPNNYDILFDFSINVYTHETDGGWSWDTTINTREGIVLAKQDTIEITDLEAHVPTVMDRSPGIVWCEAQEETFQPSIKPNQFVEVQYLENYADRSLSKGNFGCIRDSQCINSWCDTASAICVECRSDSDCDSGFCIGGGCGECKVDADCPVKDSEAKRMCDATNTRIMLEETTYTGGCEGGRCIYSENTIRTSLRDCTLDKTICSDGECGCPEGQVTCLAAKKCVVPGQKQAGEIYDCEVECASQFGENTRCVDPITTILSASRPILTVGETTPVTISLDSASSNDLDTNIVLTVPSGASLSSVDSADICTANLCKIFRRLQPKGVGKVSVVVTCESPGEIELSSKITYGTESQGNTLLDSTTLTCEKVPSPPGLWERFLSWLRQLF